MRLIKGIFRSVRDSFAAARERRRLRFGHLMKSREELVAIWVVRASYPFLVFMSLGVCGKLCEERGEIMLKEVKDEEHLMNDLLAQEAQLAKRRKERAQRHQALEDG